MDDVAVGRALRALRLRKGLRQSDLATLAGVSQSTVSRLEAGRFDRLNLVSIRAVATVLEARVLLEVRWQAADLDRLLGGRHSAMHQLLAQQIGALPDWLWAPEVSFSIYGEHGVIDVLAFHPPTGSLLVIEIKTELADLQETLGTLDRKIRLAPQIAKARGWKARSVSAWLVIAEGSTNRSRVDAHADMLRAALPAKGPEVRSWLAKPSGPIRALSFLSAPDAPRRFAQTHRVRHRKPRVENAM